MSEIKDGGPAFPRPFSFGLNSKGESVWWPPEIGLSLRDYFAAKAMQGFIAGNWFSSYEAKATEAYAVADAMLRAREAK